MFTGIIENIGVIKSIVREGTNVHFEISSEVSRELKVDQSIAHDGVCLTVVKCDTEAHVVTAVDETLVKSNLGERKVGDRLNLERCMLNNGRFDGHIVQGHVDTTGKVLQKAEKDGSHAFVFEFSPQYAELIVEKGSICINGVSLTCFNVTENTFEVAIIPYTYQNTSFSQLEEGNTINLEFDIVGKYVKKMLKK